MYDSCVDFYLILQDPTPVLYKLLDSCAFFKITESYGLVYVPNLEVISNADYQTEILQISDEFFFAEKTNSKS